MGKYVSAIILGLVILWSGAPCLAQKYEKVTPRMLMGMKSKLMGNKIEYATFMGPAEFVKEQIDKESTVVGVKAKTAEPPFTIVILNDAAKALELFWELPDNSPVTIFGELKQYSNGEPYIEVEKIEAGWPGVRTVPCPRCAGSGKIRAEEVKSPSPPRKRR